MSKLARDFLKGKGVNMAYSEPLGNEYDKTYLDPEEPMRVYLAKKAAEDSKKSEIPKAPRRSVPARKQEAPKNPETEEPPVDPPTKKVPKNPEPPKAPRVPRKPRGPQYHESDYISNVTFTMEIPGVPVIVGPPHNKSHFLLIPDSMDLVYKTWQPKTKSFKTTKMITNKTKEKTFSNPKIEAVKLGIFVFEEDLPENLRQQYKDQKSI